MTQLARKPPQLSPPSAPAPPDILGLHDGVTFRRERLAPAVRELLPLIRADWEEAGVDHEAVPLDLNWHQYLDYDLMGILQLVTARDDGVLIGYVFNFIHPHIMHSKTRWCIVDLYWLYPEYRGRGIGAAMMQTTLKFLGEAGVKVVQGSEKVAHPNGMFERLGFVKTDSVFRKLL